MLVVVTVGESQSTVETQRCESTSEPSESVQSLTGTDGLERVAFQIRNVDLRSLNASRLVDQLLQTAAVPTQSWPFSITHPSLPAPLPLFHPSYRSLSFRLFLSFACLSPLPFHALLPLTPQPSPSHLTKPVVEHTFLGEASMSTFLPTVSTQRSESESLSLQGSMEFSAWPFQ